MLLYQFRMGTNPRRVIIYLAEKSLAVPRHEFDYAGREHRSPDYLRLNPSGRAPTLITDAGVAITDSTAIIEYLEELHPDPPMIGTGTSSRARVRALERLGAELVARCQLWLWNATDAFSAKEPAPSRDVADRLHRHACEILDALEAASSANPFLAGQAPPRSPTAPPSRSCRPRASASGSRSGPITRALTHGTDGSAPGRARIAERGAGPAKTRTAG